MHAELQAAECSSSQRRALQPMEGFHLLQASQDRQQMTGNGRAVYIKEAELTGYVRAPGL